MSATLSRCAKRSNRRASVYRLVTDKILEALEMGVVPWRRPWGGEQAVPRSATTGKPYRGVNAFLLWLQADALGYESPYWVTYRQAQALGGHVRKGEKSSLVTFWTEWTPKDRDPDDPDGKVPVLRYYRVFHASQCEGLGERFTGAPRAPRNPFEPIERCERVVKGYARVYGTSTNPADVGGSVDVDGKRLPDPGRVRPSSAAGSRQATAHRLIACACRNPSGSIRPRVITPRCSTSWPTRPATASRLARKAITEPQGFGSDPYGREELVAEMGAAFLMGHCGIEAQAIDNAAAYVCGWLRAIRQDARLVVQSAAAAQKAADWILGQRAGEQEGGAA